MLIKRKKDREIETKSGAQVYTREIRKARPLEGILLSNYCNLTFGGRGRVVGGRGREAKSFQTCLQ